MVDFKEIDEARRILGLGETATLKDIKAAYRKLAQLHHPDKHGGVPASETEIMKRLNRAYKLLTDFCNEYRYSFRQEDSSGVYSKEDDYKRWRDNWSF